MHSYHSRLVVAILVILLTLSAAVAALNSISYSHNSNPAMGMYEDFNKAFTRHWKARSGVAVTIEHAQSKSGVPIHAVIDGLDVVALALSYDRGALKRSKEFKLPDWEEPVPQNSPYTSTIVFLVRKGNPKKLKDWNDLIRPGVEVITPNPKTSSNARWNYLAAWGYALKQPGGNQKSAREFMQKLFANVKAMDSGSRSSMTTFVQHDTGDVLLAWENEAHMVIGAVDGDKFEIVTPSMSILAEPTVSVVDNADSHDGARDVAKAYLDYLYTTKAQDIAGKHYFRPRDKKMAVKYATQFPPLNLFTIDELFGGWKEAQNVHFAHGGAFDQFHRN